MHRATVIHGQLQILQPVDQFVERIIIIFIQYEPEAALILVFTKEDDRSHEIRIFQKRISDQQYTGSRVVHII